MRFVAIGLVALLALAGCGDESTASTSSSDALDRSDAAQVAVAMVTALLESDFDTVRNLVRPDQLEAVHSVEQAAALGPSPEVEIVSITATVVSEDGTTALVDYAGEYCLAATTTEVPVTTAGSVREGAEAGPGSSLSVAEPERCFDLDEVFPTEPVELTRIDGEWYAPLPG